MIFTLGRLSCAFRVSIVWVMLLEFCILVLFISTLGFYTAWASLGVEKLDDSGGLEVLTSYLMKWMTLWVATSKGTSNGWLLDLAWGQVEF